MYCCTVRHAKVSWHAAGPALRLGAVLLGVCCALSSAASGSKFSEADTADFIARYYSDQTSYILKPLVRVGPYQSIYDRPALLKLARQQSGRELAVIVLMHYPSAAFEETIKLAFVNDLTELGYRRIVFLRAGNKMRVNGLLVLSSPRAPATFAGK
jgi:hypothetical protein